MELPKYHVDIFWSDEDDCWFAVAPDFKYLSAWGVTRAEALWQLESVMETVAEMSQEECKPLPEVQYVSLASHPWLEEEPFHPGRSY